MLERLQGASLTAGQRLVYSLNTAAVEDVAALLLDLFPAARRKGGPR